MIRAGASLTLAAHDRLVIKIGSALLVDRETGALNRPWLEALADDLATLARAGKKLIVVSSGAIALGRRALSLSRKSMRLEDSQAAAAIGQIELAKAYAEVFADRNLVAAQILLTLADTEERRRYLNARSTLGTLWSLGAVPVINENDTVATTEIRYGDNDRLAARVATMMSADCLVLLSDVDGLYTSPPGSDPAARHLSVVETVSADIEAMAGDAGSDLSRGGMRTKIDAARIAVEAGTRMVIASGKRLNPLAAIEDGARATWFLAKASPRAARKAWIAGALEPTGAVVVDEGAERALTAGRSLLPAGVSAISGVFARGDAVAILGTDGHEIGRGLIAYDSRDADRIRGRNSREIESILGYPGRKEMIHRDDMALRDSAKSANKVQS
ncbi:MAG: glutamate 5-kinase [Pseudomonadota bacterium]